MIRVAALAAVLATVPSCSGVKCGDGTFMQGNDCVGFDPNDHTPPVTTMSPPGGRTRAALPTLVTLMTDEPAKIYYTTDGSDPDPTTQPGQRDQATIAGITQNMTIKFFAIDTAGNKEALQSATFASDSTPPAAVGGLAVTLSGTTAHVTWTNPTDADYAGTVLARVADVVDGAPPPGQMVTAPTALTPSLQIISVGTGTQFDDPGLPPGPVRYAAWSFDDLGNYSTAVAASAAIPLGALTAQLTFNATNSTLTVVTPPANLDLTASTAVLAGTTLTVTLAVKNGTMHYFQNPKAELVSVTNAAFGNSDGTADGHPFRTLGPNMLAPGKTTTRDLVFTGVGAGTTATINLAFAEHHTLLTTDGQQNRLGMVDLGSNATIPSLAMTALGPNDRVGGRVRPSFLVGGHFLDVPNTHGVIERYDLATGAHVGSVVVGSDQRTNVQSVIRNSADMIAIVKFGGRRRTGDLHLFRIDEGLHVIGDLALPFSDDKGFGRPALSADGSMLAIPLSSGIVLVDPRTMTPIDPDPTTPDIDAISTGMTGPVRSIVFFNGTAGMVALGRTNGQAAIIKQTPSGYASTPYQDADMTAKGWSAALGPDGRVWMAFSSDVVAYNPTTDSVQSVAYPNGPSHGLSMVDGQMWIIRNDRLNLDQVSVAGAVQRTLTVTTGGVYGEWIDSAH